MKEKREVKMIHGREVVCEIKRMSLKEYGKKIDLERMTKNVERFIVKEQKARVITDFSNLILYDTVYVEKGHPVFRQDFGNTSIINLSNILTEYEITDSQLIAVKVWRIKCEYTVDVLKFPLENYGKTWRCWSAVPKEEQIREEMWL